MIFMIPVECKEIVTHRYIIEVNAENEKELYNKLISAMDKNNILDCFPILNDEIIKTEKIIDCNIEEKK